MFISFNPRVPFIGATEIEAITGARNGSFSLQIVKDNVKCLLMYDKLGHSLYEVHREEMFNYGVFLGEANCLIGHASLDDEHKTHVSGKAYLGDVICFEDAEVFSNDWFVLRVEGTNKLFNRALRVQAEGFKKALMFRNGYALCYDDSSWKLFSLKGRFVREVQQVIGFVGDGLVLVKSDNGETWLESFKGKTLIEKPIISFYNYNENCFVLTTEDGFSRMYRSDGSRISEETRDAEFFPDGCFVQMLYGGKMVSAIYRPNGILDKRPVYSYEMTENYYLINAENEQGRLFDEEGKELGSDFSLIEDTENFALFEHKDRLKLFNQFGLALSIKKQA